MFDENRVSRRTALATGGSLFALGASGLATAHVSKVSAFLAGEEYTDTDARIRMRDTAEDLGLSSDQQGRGLVDAAAATGLDSSDD